MRLHDKVHPFNSALSQRHNSMPESEMQVDARNLGVVIVLIIELVSGIPLRLSYEELNTKDKGKVVLLKVVPRRNVIIMHGLYITRERELHDNRWIIDNQYGKANK